jgi:hypothetical protein
MLIDSSVKNDALGFVALILPELERMIYQLRNKKEKSVIGQYRPYLTTTGSKPISPIPTTSPIKQMLYFVILNDIHFIFV